MNAQQWAITLTFAPVMALLIWLMFKSGDLLNPPCVWGCGKPQEECRNSCISTPIDREEVE